MFLCLDYFFSIFCHINPNSVIVMNAGYFKIRAHSNNGAYLGLDHVNPSCSQLSNTVVDVYHTLSVRHVQHDVNDDETTSTSCPRTYTHIQIKTCNTLDLHKCY